MTDTHEITRASDIGTPEMHRQFRGVIENKVTAEGQRRAFLRDTTEIGALNDKGLISPVQYETAKQLVGYRDVALHILDAQICHIYGGEKTGLVKTRSCDMDEVYFEICKLLPVSHQRIIYHVVYDNQKPDIDGLDLLKDALDTAQEAIWQALNKLKNLIDTKY